MDTKGGRYSLDIDGQTFSGRAKATINPSNVELANEANQDGTGYTTVKPGLYGIELTFDRGSGIKWNAAMLLKKVNVTFREDDVGLTHYLTGARWQGKPAIDTENGEVSGLSLMSDQYSSAAA